MQPGRWGSAEDNRPGKQPEMEDPLLMHPRYGHSIGDGGSITKFIAQYGHVWKNS
jgi:hypothetical protein